MIPTTQHRFCADGESFAAAMVRIGTRSIAHKVASRGGHIVDHGDPPLLPTRCLRCATGLLTPKDRELLAIIRDKNPQSIAELAERTGRKSPNVTRTLGELEAVGFVRMNVLKLRAPFKE